MKHSILLLAVSAAALTSCTTSYKSGQTPDDVYYSPVRPQDEYVRTEKEDDRSYKSDEEYYDDRYLRMKVHNRTRWSELDEWYSYGNRYNYSSFPHIGIYNNPWTPFTYWNNYYNPYCHSCCVIVNPKSSVAYNKPRTFNLNTYNNNSLTNQSYTNPKPVRVTSNTYTTPRNSNSHNNPNAGNILRDIFGGSNNNKSGTSNNNSNNSSSSGNSGGSSSGNSGGSAPVRKF
jgi:uncharacterized membrane protein YgcG